MVTLVQSKKLNDQQKEIEGLKFIVNEIGEVIEKIQTGNLNIELSETVRNSKLGFPVQSLLGYLQSIKEEEGKRAWFNKGLSFFLEILKNNQGVAMDKLLDRALSELIKYIGANQGAIFILNKEGDNLFLEMVACYAYEKKKYISKRQHIGEGLAGQCVLERDIIYLKNIPRDYVAITSGLGEATPRNVIITPLMISEVVVGVIELASFAELSQYEIDFIKKISESLASLIKSGREKIKLEEVLEMTQRQAEELRSQEEEMRQNLEEMEALQEQLSRNEIELKRRLQDMEQALLKEKSSEIARIREEEKQLLESKLETQKNMYEIIINKLKDKLKNTVANTH
jgi:GAF domain-containing protein